MAMFTKWSGEAPKNSGGANSIAVLERRHSVDHQQLFMQYQTIYPYATTSQQYGARSNQREEQRRRQQEYSQALAQQVAQREQQKRRDREMDRQDRRRSSAFSNPPNQNFRQEAFASAERGILDGLGHNNLQNTRKSFARGQPQPHLHHRLPGGPESFDYPQGNNFPPPQHGPFVDNQAFQSGFGFPDNQPPPMPQHGWPQQNLQQQPIRNGPVSGVVGSPPVGPEPSMQAGWGALQIPHQNAMAQAGNSQFWAGQGNLEQAAPPPAFPGYGSPQRPNFQTGIPQGEPLGYPHAQNGGRRMRTDIHDGGRGDQEEAERLRRKQQRQHEMQLALERQIEEKRQQKLAAKRRQEEEDRREMERFHEEQCRQRAEQERVQEEKRRNAELAQQKADQAAAAVAAANQQAKQQRKLHAQLQHPQNKAQPYQPPPQAQQPELFSNAPSPDRSKNPFANSRAHLFEDPPQPQREPIPATNHFGYSNQNASPIRGSPQSFGHTFQHENKADHFLDPTELRRQYDDMREELSRQRQLVDQLRQAQAQIQQQRSPVRLESGNAPTLMDLEKLRTELRGELAYREQLHRQELESLRREQQHERSSIHSPHRKVDRLSSHPETIEQQEEPTQQRDPPVKKQHVRSRINHLSHLDEAPLNGSVMSLRGESEFVYFEAEAGSGIHKGEDEQDGAALDEQSESIKVAAPLIRKSTQKSVQFSLRKPSTKQSAVRRPVNSQVSDTDSDDDDHGFIVAGITSSLSHQQLSPSPTSHSLRSAASSHRYSQIPQVLSSSSPSKVSSKWRLESMNTTDSDDDLEESLDGDQLEALFQRNVRRHEILLGFQSKFQGQPQREDIQTPHAKLAWAELHQQLERNRRISTLQKLSTTSTTSNDSNQEQTVDDEAALIASSKWMSSAGQSNRRTNVVNK